jgi:DNA-binding protein H-NS
MSIDLTQFTAEQLDALIAAAAEQKRRQQRERIGEVRKKVAALAKSEGYTIEELFGGAKPARGGSKVAPKYRNPTNPEQTWSGRGKRPKWMEAAIAGGKKVEDFKI